MPKPADDPCFRVSPCVAMNLRIFVVLCSGFPATGSAFLSGVMVCHLLTTTWICFLAGLTHGHFRMQSDESDEMYNESNRLPLPTYVPHGRSDHYAEKKMATAFVRATGKIEIERLSEPNESSKETAMLPPRETAYPIPMNQKSNRSVFSTCSEFKEFKPFVECALLM